MVTRAPAKLNLCLYLGPVRGDGLHELRSLFCPLALSDRIAVTSSDADRDEVVCDEVAEFQREVFRVTSLEQDGILALSRHFA